MTPNLSSTIQIQPLFREIEKGVFKVRSKSHPNCSHTVRTEARGLTCNCPARVRCWHIKEIEKFLGIKSPKPVSAERKALGEDFMVWLEAEDREILRSHGLKVAEKPRDLFQPVIDPGYDADFDFEQPAEHRQAA